MLIRNREEITPITYRDDAKGVQMRELITNRDGAPTFAMRVFTLEPGGHTPLHQHAWEHEVYILGGSGAVHGQGGERAIRSGDSVFIAPHELHQFRSGELGLQFICCVPNH